MDRRLNFTSLIFVCIPILILFPAVLIANGIIEDAGAVESAYTIQEGDTLWDISSEKLKDPFLWKKIWKQNPHIKNPDLIFPGQKLVIPGEMTGTGGKAGEKEESEDAELQARKIVAEKIPGKQITAKKRAYLVSRQTLLNSGYISDAVPAGAGKISGSPQKKSVMGRGDFVYIDTDTPPAIKTKCYILSKPEKIIHPITDDVVGYFIKIKGVLETAGEEHGNKKALVLESYEEILINDMLSPYYTFDQPLAPIIERKPGISGAIIKIHQDKSIIGSHGIVYVDKGAADGLQIGDMFTVITREKPNMPIGAIQIISVRDKTSVAVIKKSSSEITSGDSIRN